jgi:curved DNA-binding protein CbpA
MQDIKLAYRRLAKQYHPDLNPGNESRFREITEAYETLSDSEQKRKYDDRRRRRITKPDYSAYHQHSKPEEQAEEKDNRHRKPYSPEDWQRARETMQRRKLYNMGRRRKLLVGMSITFVLYIVATILYSMWIEEYKKKQAVEIQASMEQISKKNKLASQLARIQDLDSPFDNLFGEGRYIWLSPNEIVVANNFSDAVICLEDDSVPANTIRNEYVYKGTAFILRDLPNGKFRFKIYTGKNWDKKKQYRDRKQLGGFTSEEQYWRIEAGPFKLQKNTAKNPNGNESDTIMIDSARVKLVEVGRADWFK